MFGKFREKRALKNIRGAFAKLTSIPGSVHPMSTAPLRLAIYEAADDIGSLVDVCDDAQLVIELIMRFRVSREIIDTAHNLGHGNSPSYGCLDTDQADLASRVHLSAAAKQSLCALVAQVHANVGNAAMLLQLHKENMLAGINAINSYQLTRELYEI